MGLPGRVGRHREGDDRQDGLRTGEVALLADISVEYYTRLERGSVTRLRPTAGWRWHRPASGSFANNSSASSAQPLCRD
jgi:hypothetical protein